MSLFKINNIDISNDVSINSFNYVDRIDDVFGSGSFQFESKSIDYNIPPYSVLEIDSDYYCCSSEATYHFGRKSWFHNVNVIEATSILSRFLVGSKAFSVTGTNTYDYDKINILTKLISDKYGVSFDLIYDKTFDKQIEYVFGAGTTLYDALSEIADNYSCRVKVTSIYDNIIIIRFVDLLNIETETLPNSKILSVKKIQNPEGYCKNLESEANNVVDSNNITKVDFIYPTADGVKLAEDTYIIKTPTPIYKLHKFIANKTMGNKMIVTLQLRGEDLFDPALGESEEFMTYEQWASRYSSLNDLYQQVFKKYFPDWEDFKQRKWFSSIDENNRTDFNWLRPADDGYLTEPLIKVDLTHKILSKEQYDLLEIKDKPDYAYYTSGSNTLDGFTLRYKDDFWNKILGNANLPFLNNYATSEVDKSFKDKWYPEWKIIDFEVTGLGYASALNSNFEIQYYSYSNPFIKETTTMLPNNESDFKDYSISYGKSANSVDFDKLMNQMRITNNSSGKNEMVIELLNDKNLYISGKFVEFNEEKWFVSNVVNIYKENQKIAILNLVKSNEKIADIISLDSQYNTTKNPLDNIIERPIFVETKNEFEVINGKTYFMLDFWKSDETSIVRAVIPAIILYDNINKYFYCEALDQFSIGKRVSKEIDLPLGEGVKVLADIPYVDANNEAFKIKIHLINIDNLTLEQSEMLPHISTKVEYVKLFSSETKQIFKDAREKLTFTIKANNCIIK